MVREPDGGSVLRRYLLGLTPDGEKEWLEQALLTDENLYEELLATEDELVDEYVWGRLPESQRDGFLQYLSSLPDYQEKLQFAEAMRSHRRVSPIETPTDDEAAPSEHALSFHTRVPALVLVAATLLVLLGGVWAAITISDLREQIGRTRSELARLRERQDELPRRGTNDAQSRPELRSVLLAAGAFRSGGARQVVPIPREPELLELRLDLGSADYLTYQAVVHDANGVALVSVSQLHPSIEPDRILVVFNLSSDWFTPGDYYISLLGELEGGANEPVARYDFRISRE